MLRSLVLAAVLGAGAPALAADTFAVDAVHSSVLFQVSHLEVSEFYGRFNDVSGTFVLDDANPSASKLELVVKAQSVDTNNDKRDDHLRSPDFFNAGQFPVITFTATAFQKTASGWTVTGDFSLHGVTKRITVPFKGTGEGADPWGGYRKGAHATFTLKRSDYGMDYMMGGLGDEVRLTISLEGLKK